MWTAQGESNLTPPSEQCPRKVEALAAHCERLGRNRSEIAVSQHLNVVIASTLDDAYKAVVEFLRSRGLDIEGMDEDSRNAFLNVVVWGDEDQVGDKLSGVLALGADGITCSLPGTAHEIESVEQLGKTASKVLGL